MYSIQPSLMVRTSLLFTCMELDWKLLSIGLCSLIGWSSCSSPAFVHTDSDAGGATVSALNLTLDSRPSDTCSIRWFLLSKIVGSMPTVLLPCLASVWEAKEHCDWDLSILKFFRSWRRSRPRLNTTSSTDKEPRLMKCTIEWSNAGRIPRSFTFIRANPRLTFFSALIRTTRPGTAATIDCMKSFEHWEFLMRSI